MPGERGSVYFSPWLRMALPSCGRPCRLSEIGWQQCRLICVGLLESRLTIGQLSARRHGQNGGACSVPPRPALSEVLSAASRRNMSRSVTASVLTFACTRPWPRSHSSRGLVCHGDVGHVTLTLARRPSSVCTFSSAIREWLSTGTMSLVPAVVDVASSFGVPAG